jgi:alpha-ketoglutarate-dependent taurine dioxygenase
MIPQVSVAVPSVCVTPGFPVVVEHASPAPFADWAAEHRAWIDATLLECGAVLFRGFAVTTPDRFASGARALCGSLLDYVYRSTPRTQVGAQVYTATEYPASASIPMHNENAYQREWPMRLVFGCLRSAAEGGETPLARTARVTARIRPDVIAAFRERGVMYERNYGGRVDLSWQTTFHTEERKDVEAYCDAHDIAYEWRRDGGLRTRQVCQALAVHPQTGQELWFNQAHLFHPSSLGPQQYAAMREVFGDDGLPRHARYGDGGDIDDAVFAHVRRAYELESRAFPWRDGDVLLVDNMLVCHGRRPFKGSRTVLVAMGDRRPI